MVEVTVTQADVEAAHAWIRQQTTGLQMMMNKPRGLYEAFARHRASTAPDAEPAALAQYCGPYERELEWYRHGAGRLTDADKEAGWTETPLYAHPPRNDAVVEALRATAEAAATHLKDGMRMREALTLALDLIQGTHEYDPSHPVVAKLIDALKQGEPR